MKNDRTLPAEERNRRSRPRTVSRGTPDAAAIPRNPWPSAARASMSPITAVPSQRRASSHAGSSTCVTPQDAHRARRGRIATGTRPAVNPAAGPRDRARPAAPRTRDTKAGRYRELLDAGRVVAYREQWCLRAPSRPSPSFAKGNGEGRPHSDMLKVSSRTSRPQPEPRENTPAHRQRRIRPTRAHRKRRLTA